MRVLSGLLAAIFWNLLTWWWGLPTSSSHAPAFQPQAPLPHESGWKDTVPIYPGQMVRVIAKFEDYLGKFPYHCHILEHAASGMMGTILVE